MNIKRYVISLCMSFIVLIVSAVNIVPHPMEYDVNPYVRFYFDESTSIVVKDKELYAIADVVANTLRRSTGYKFPILKRGRNSIVLRIDKTIKNKEGYYLNISPFSIDIYGGSKEGVFYGLQSLLQLLPPEIESSKQIDRVWSVPCAVIEDEPRFQYRGVLCDPCRHFLPIDSIKKQIDWMSKYKLNVLHLHLTDDQLWTIEIRKYPKLTEVGAVRKESNGSVHSGYYTQEELKDLVKYAENRCVKILPEIEMPGHVMAALASYPFLGCKGDSYKVRNLWGVDENLLCVGNDSIFSFIQNVLEEVTEIFPSEYIHIGGDECPTTIWHNCSKCQNIMKINNFSSERELYGYFLEKVNNIVHQLGRKLICWDDAIEGNISNDATIMIWRDGSNISHIISSYKSILTPWSICYFDHYQADKKWEKSAQTGFTSLKEVYEWEVIPSNLQNKQINNIFGIQANVWAEYLYSNADRERMMYPRLLALAENAWSIAQKDWNYFVQRVDSAYLRFYYGNVNAHIPKPFGPIAQYIEFDSVETVLLYNELDWPIYYRLLSDNVQDSAFVKYDTPFNISNSSVLEAVSLSPNGIFSNPITVQYKKIKHNSRQFTNNAQGLYKSRYRGSIQDMCILDTMKSDYPELVDSMYIKIEDNYSSPWVDVYQGYIMIDSSSRYIFTSDLEQVWINGVKIIDNTSVIKRGLTKLAVMNLKEGLYPIKLVYNNCINDGFPAIWRKPTLFYKNISQEHFNVVPSTKFYR